MSDVVLRRARGADAPAIADIWFDGWQDGHLGNVPDELVTLRDRDSFYRRAPERVGDAIVAEIDGVVGGFVMVVGAEVEQVYVAAQYRGGGVAGALLAAAEERVRDNGHAVAWLAVSPGNTRARRFYAKFGWTDDGPYLNRVTDRGDTVDVPTHRYVKPVG
ncbi:MULTISPECIES: GNAT family N-acetyltransferase [unclassified Nocardia]|uniref:GNAT family N-acetyltransferase n=1 Tax=unclassified Nocardia TaxID=2637762 RepID=UPI001CE46281|nr:MULTISPECIES: GNAT family N-acetyltransferase [unclassified Nocardia]